MSSQLFKSTEDDVLEAFLPNEDDDKKGITSEKEFIVEINQKGEKVEELVDFELPKSSPFSLIFKYSTRNEKVLFGFAVFCSGIASISNILSIIIFKLVLDSGNTVGTFDSGISFNELVLLWLLNAVFALLHNFVRCVLFTKFSNATTFRWRINYFKALISNEIAVYDKKDQNKFTTSLIKETIIIQDGLGDKFSQIINLAFSGILSGIFAFYVSWKLALAILSVVPLMIIFFVINNKKGKNNKNKNKNEDEDENEVSGELILSTLQNIRTVISFNSQARISKKYEDTLDSVYEQTKKDCSKESRSYGLVNFFLGAMIAIGIGYGYKLLTAPDNFGCEATFNSSCFTVSSAYVIIYALGTFAIQIGGALSNFFQFKAALNSLGKINAIIERKSKIDPYSNKGIKLQNIEGVIEFQNIYFSYPTRKEHFIYKNFNLIIKAGETCALVGPSGTGKSTAILLLERFYDPLKGIVKIDGHDIRDLNLKWYRRQLGLVSQEPALFSTTIAENIAYGLDEDEDISLETIQLAAKNANAHDFIMNFPNGYNTLVGTGGGQLSGGQKQRIAIARALIRQPIIFLFDEATSALDNTSEKVVQAAIDKLLETQKRTTIIVAHRLSTIRQAHRICVLDGTGGIGEEGSHDELMKISNGIYQEMVNAVKEKSKDDMIKENLENEFQEETSDLEKNKLKDTGSSLFHLINNETNKSEEELLSVKEVTSSFNAYSWVYKLIPPIYKFQYYCFGFIVIEATRALFNAVFLGMTYNVLSFPTVEEIRQHAITWIIIIFSVQFVITVATIGEKFCSLISGKLCVRECRKIVFNKILTMHVGWYDDSNNSPGKLVQSIQVDCEKVEYLLGLAGNNMLTSCIGVFYIYIIAFVLAWPLGLLYTILFPLYIFFLHWQAKRHKIGSNVKMEIVNDAGAMMTETVTQIRTVTANSLHKKIISVVTKKLKSVIIKYEAQSYWLGLSNGIADAVVPCSLALSFLVLNTWLEHDTSVNSGFGFLALLLGIMSLISLKLLTSDVPGLVDAIQVVKGIILFLNVKPEIETLDDKGIKLQNIEGVIEFQNIYFSYPTRKEHFIYKNFNLIIKVGETCALVGPSGTGKSTAILLLERFYDPLKGIVKIDGHDIRDLNLKWYRRQLGLVSQEPALFSTTIAENIAYGLDEDEDISLETIQLAAKNANAHDFIMNFPNGYNTLVGTGGGQLSGGQKQRIAIARALIRQPIIFLFDEATSALDNTSEKVVQAAIDKLLETQKRTTIIVAHRLSTIRQAHRICVLDGTGGIGEEGSHDELMKIPNGIYQEMVAISN